MHFADSSKAHNIFSYLHANAYLLHIDADAISVHFQIPEKKSKNAAFFVLFELTAVLKLFSHSSLYHIRLIPPVWG
jgi:predicted membrane channel-forming protein YqfA (hemolysin III family)